MDAKEVVDKILSDANAEAETIKKEAAGRQAAKQAELAEQLAEYKKQTEMLAQKTAEEKKSHILAAARMEIAKEYLATKRVVLDEIFSGAKEQIKKLPDDEYRGIMSKLMLAAVETGDEEVLVDKNESRIDHKFVKLLNRELEPGYKGNLRLSDERLDLGAGFILRRGKIKNNVSLEVLLAEARKALEIEMAKELFGN